MLAVPPATAMASCWLAPPPPLLAVALDDEEGVVDPDRQPDHRDHVDDEEGEREQLPDHRRQPDGDPDRDQGKHDRHAGGNQGTEDDDQDQQRHREPDPLGGPQVGFGGGRELLVDAQVADGQDAEPVRATSPERLLVCRKLPLGLVEVANEGDRDQRRVTVGGDQPRGTRRTRGFHLVVGRCRGDDPVHGGQIGGKPLDHPPKHRIVDRGGFGPHDDRLRDRIRLTHAGTEQVATSYRLRVVGEIELGGQCPVEPPDGGDDGEREGEDPETDDEPRTASAGTRETGGRAQRWHVYPPSHT